MSESLKTVLSEWRPINGEGGSVSTCHCDMPVTDARRPTHCHLCGHPKRKPSPAGSDDPTEVENAAQAALIRKMANALAVVRDALTAAREAGITGESDVAEAKPLLDRLRKDGDSWAQPLFNEAADRIDELERRLAKEEDGHKRCFELSLFHQERAEEAERQLAEMRARAAFAWLPIEIAPEYGTFLVWESRRPPVVAHRSATNPAYPDLWLLMTSIPLSSLGGYTPTHWMPVPHPPEHDVEGKPAEERDLGHSLLNPRSPRAG